MRVLLSTYGSRGDTEPVAALASALQALGAEAIVCAPPDQEFADLVARAGVSLVPAFSTIRDWVTEVKTRPETDPALRAAEIVRRAAGIVTAQFEVIDAAAEGCDAIVGTGLFPSAAAAQTVAELKGVPFVCATFCPVFLPSTHHRPYEYPAHPFPPGVTENRSLWDFDIQTKNALFAEGANGLRSRVGLAPVDNVRDRVFTNRPWLAADPILGPWRETDLCDVVQTGAWILSDRRPLPTDLLEFLDAGTPPVFVGFGSMPMAALQAAARAAIDASRAQERRVVLSQGWAGLGLVDDQSDCLVVGDVNQQALFRRVAAVVHHGGAGTTTAAARAGAPQVIVPQVADQPYWGSRIAELGAGVAHDGPVPTFESLSAALKKALTPEARSHAASLAGAIRADGAAVAARMLLDEISSAQPS